MSINGIAGANFNLTESSVTSGAITINETTTITSSISDVALAGTEKVIYFNGTVGVTSFDLDLNNLVTYSPALGSIVPQRQTQPIDLTTLKVLHIVNKGIAGEKLTISAAIANSFLDATSKVILYDAALNNSVFSLVYPLGRTIGANGKITIVSDTAATALEIYILGI